VKAAALVALLALLVYAPSAWTGELLGYDDDHYVFHSAPIAHGDIGTILSPTESRTELGNEYLPVRDLTYVIDAKLWGVSDLYDQKVFREDPRWLSASRGFRATNLFFYALACALAYRFLLELTKDPVLAFLAAALFAVHPIHAESAAWISSRKDLVSGALGFASLTLHLRAHEGQPRLLPYAFALVLGLLAMLAKSTLTCLPLLIVLCELAAPALRRERARIVGAFPPGPRRPLGEILLSAVPYLVFALAVGLNAASVGKRNGILVSLPLGGLATVLATDGPILVRYIAASFVPTGLRVSYHGSLQLLTFSSELAVGTWAALIFMASWIVPAARRGPKLLAFAAVWFVLGLAPVLNVIPVVQWIGERFLFLPVLGPCLVLAWALIRLRHLPRFVAPLAAAILLGTFGSLAVLRGLDFANGERLFRSNLALEPRNPIARHELGRSLLFQAEAAARRGDLARCQKLAWLGATEEETAIEIFKQPGSLPTGKILEASHSLARCFELAGDLAKAVSIERMTLRVELDEGRPVDYVRDAAFRLGQRAIAGTRDERDAPLMLEAARCFAFAHKPGLTRAAFERAKQDVPALAQEALEEDDDLRRALGDR
jgi:hypothetical protein